MTDIPRWQGTHGDKKLTSLEVIAFQSKEIEDVRDASKKLKKKVDALKKKYLGKTPKCSNGHENVVPLSRWCCPMCVDIITIQRDRFTKALIVLKKENDQLIPDLKLSREAGEISTKEAAHLRREVQKLMTEIELATGDPLAILKKLKAAEAEIERLKVELRLGFKREDNHLKEIERLKTPKKGWTG